ncbi:MAG TPA: hypothetical protein VL334_14010, partial [Anaerolineae bacterium]|nr:hypothetical protein [Anaerolineae bacterium]
MCSMIRFSRTVRLAVVVVALLCAAGLWMLMSQDAAASSDCTLGFLDGVAVAIDGSIGAGEWDDAAKISSGDPCLDQLPDLGAVPKNVDIYTKRYTRSGSVFLGFRFDVLDTSTSGPVAGGVLL